MTIGQTASKTKAALAAAAVLGLPAVAWAGPADTYYERAFVVAADARCNLFAPHIDAALNAATVQARGAARISAVIVLAPLSPSNGFLAISASSSCSTCW